MEAFELQVPFFPSRAGSLPIAKPSHPCCLLLPSVFPAPTQKTVLLISQECRPVQEFFC